MSTTSNLRLNKHDNVSTNTNPFDIDNYLNANWDKIDEYAGNSNSTILKLQEENARLKETIKTELEEKTIEAESIEVNDSAEANCEIDLQGNTTQETTTGINKFNTARIETGTKNGVTCTYNSNDDSITFNGTCTTDNTVFQLPSENIIKGNPGKTKIIAYWLNGSATNMALVMLFDSSFNKGLRADLTVLNSNKRTTSASYGSSETQVDFINNRIRFNSGSVLNNFTIKVMIVEDGQTTETPYEKYTGGEASPNPDYPQKVETVTGSVEVKISNKNLLNYNNVNFKSNKRTWYFLDGNSGAYGSDIASKTNIKAKVQKNETYTISYEIIEVPRDLQLVYEDEANITLLSTEIGKHTYTFTSNRDGYVIPRINVEDGYWGRINEIQIEKGSQATGSVLHKEQTHQLYLPFELCKIGDYKDYIFKKNNKWYKYKVIDKIIFNGSENWSLADTVQGIYQFQINNNKALYSNKGIKILSDYFKGIEWDNSWLKDNSITIGTNIIRIMTSKYSNVNDFKTWLSNNNTTVYYVLATPVDEEITDTTLIQQLNELENAMSYYGTTYVDTTNEVIKPILKFTYNRSNRLRIENLENAIINY